MAKTRRGGKRANGRARPIKTKRDFERASSVVKQLSVRADRDSSAELRLQSLLKELDRFDDADDEVDSDLSGEANYPGPRRRWSDDASEE